MTDVDGTLEVRSDRPVVLAAAFVIALAVGLVLAVGFVSLRTEIREGPDGEVRCVATTVAHRDGLACGWSEP